MKPMTRRNLLVWSGVLAIVATIWFFASRARLQFVDPSMFLVILAAAAAALSMLLWWEVASDDTDGGRQSKHPTEGEQP